MGTRGVWGGNEALPPVRSQLLSVHNTANTGNTCRAQHGLDKPHSIALCTLCNAPPPTSFHRYLLLEPVKGEEDGYRLLDTLREHGLPLLQAR